MKRVVYILLTIFLFLEFGYLFHSVFNVMYVNFVFKDNGLFPDELFSGYFYTILPVWAYCIFGSLLVFTGLFVGKKWWRIVYIEKRHWRFKH
jgi:hypothetical protein